LPRRSRFGQTSGDCGSPQELANIDVQVISAEPCDPAAPQTAIAEAVAHHGRPDPLVNNAGATKRADFVTLTEEDWQDGFYPR
jgi:NAD(P)-dependent dehydrogenase (short-subunit alcohol dehydrogenase family)